MKVGSLFSGGGLGDFGFMAAGMDITWQCEIDEYCQKILELRYPESKKYRDIKTLKGSELEPVDIITGGFPCQPFSVAGQQMGKPDDRHLWPEMFRVIQEVKPRWVVGENVSGFVDMALDDVCANLESAGYETTTLIFPAHALGAWHRRERVWIVGYAKHLRRDASKESGSLDQGNDNSTSREKQASKPSRSGEQYASLANASNARAQGMCKWSKPSNKNVCFSTGKRLERETGSILQGNGSRSSFSNPWKQFWKSEPDVGRVANGTPNRIHRLKMLGNGQVPACTYVIGKMIMDIEKENLI